MRKRQEAIALGKKARQDRVLSSPIHEAELPTPSDLAAFSSSPQGARPAKSSIPALPGFPIGCVSMHFPEHSAPTQSEEPTTEQSTSIPAQSGFPIGCVSMHFPEHSASTQSEQPTTEQSRSPPRQTPASSTIPSPQGAAASPCTSPPVSPPASLSASSLAHSSHGTKLRVPSVQWQAAQCWSSP